MKEEDQTANLAALVAASASWPLQLHQLGDAESNRSMQVAMQMRLAAAAAAAFSGAATRSRSGLPPRGPNLFTRGGSNASSSSSSRESTCVAAPPQGHAPSSFPLVPEPPLASLLSTPRQSSPIHIPSPGSAALHMDGPMLDGELQPPLPQSAYLATPTSSPYRHDAAGGSLLSESDRNDQSMLDESLPAMDTSSSSNDTSRSSGTSADFLQITPLRHSPVDSDAPTPETGLRTPRRRRSGRAHAAMLGLSPSLGSPMAGSAIGRELGISAPAAASSSSALGALLHPAGFSPEELSDKENSAGIPGRPWTRGGGQSAAAAAVAAEPSPSRYHRSLRPPLMPRPGHELASRSSTQAAEAEAAAASRSLTAGQSTQLYQLRLRRTLQLD